MDSSLKIRQMPDKNKGSDKNGTDASRRETHSKTRLSSPLNAK